MRFCLVAISLSLSVSCIGDDLDTGTEVAAAWAGGCGLDCGSNSPIVDGVPFPDLALDGITRNAYGAKLVEVLSPSGFPLNLSVVRDRLYVQAPGSPWTHALQENSRIVINLPIGGAYEDLELVVVAVSRVKHWVDPGADEAPIYRLAFEDTVGNRHDICPTPVLDDSSGFLADMPDHHMFAFGGNKFDHGRKTVRGGRATNGWVNFACEGGAIAKLHLTRHTAAGSNAGHQASNNELQALLKMFVADYCGDGGVNTTHGHALKYSDDNSWFPDNNFYPGGPDDTDGFFIGIDGVEAIWNQDGAVCLLEPRLSSLEYEHIVCDGGLIPKCTNKQISGWANLGHLISANPL